MSAFVITAYIFDSVYFIYKLC